MSKNTLTQHKISKSTYISPYLDVIHLAEVDVITASDLGDANQAEWDSQ